MRAKFIYEKFTEDSDPIEDLGIGQRHLIEKWFKQLEAKYIISRSINYEINDDLTIDVIGYIDLSFNDITSLPWYIRFNCIHGDFSCGFNEKDYIKYMPKEVKCTLRYYADSTILDFKIAKKLIKSVVKAEHIVVTQTFK